MLFDHYLKNIGYEFTEGNNWVSYIRDYAVRFEIFIKDKRIGIQIPLENNLNINNIKNADYGKFNIYNVEGNYYKMIYSDFNLNKAMDKLKEHIGENTTDKQK